MAKKSYQYTECGLDYVRLMSGFRFVDSQGGEAVIIEDIDGLHQAIGRFLVHDRKNLTGSEIRFLRHELEMSQSALSMMLGVDEQTVARWERGQTNPNPAAERTLRLLYSEHTGGNEKITDILRRIADLEDQLDQHLELEETDNGWGEAA